MTSKELYEYLHSINEPEAANRHWYLNKILIEALEEIASDSNKTEKRQDIARAAIKQVKG